MVFLTSLAFESELHVVQLLSERFGAGLLFSGLAHRSSLHLLDNRLIGAARFDGELARQQEIAAKTFGDLHDVAAMAKLFYVFFQNDFHGFTNQKFVMCPAA